MMMEVVVTSYRGKTKTKIIARKIKTKNNTMMGDKEREMSEKKREKQKSSQFVV